MFCSICGKELREGETCTCQQTAAAQQTEESVQQPENVQQAENTQQTEESVQQTENVQQTEGNVQQPGTASSLPSGSDIAAGAKNAAQAVKNNPIVSDVLNVIKGAFKDPVKQTVECAKRTDILWVILAVLEALIFSFASTIFVRRLIHFAVSVMGSGLGYKASYSNTSEMLKLMGVTSVKMFGVSIGTIVITFAAALILMILAVALCKRKAGFSQAANMLTAAFLPSAMLLLVSMVMSLLCAPISLLLFVAAYISFIVLAYLGMQKLDKFTSSPFRIYMVFATLVTVIGSFVNLKLAGSMVGKIAGDLMSSLSLF